MTHKSRVSCCKEPAKHLPMGWDGMYSCSAPPQPTFVRANKYFKEYICLCCNFDECHTLIQANNWVIALCHLNPLETVRWSPKQFGHTFLPRLVHVAHTLLWQTNSAFIGNFPPTLWSIISWKSLRLFSPGWQTQPTISIHLKLLIPLLSQQAGGGWPNQTTVGFHWSWDMILFLLFTGLLIGCCPSVGANEADAKVNPK